MPQYTCQNCDWKGDKPDDAKDLHLRISPGEPYTDSECPECGALVHEDKQKVAGFFIEDDLMDKLWKLSADLQGGSDRERDYGHRLSLVLRSVRQHPITA